MPMKTSKPFSTLSTVANSRFPLGKYRKKHWWKLLWLQDRCTKPENDNRRRFVNHVVQSYGGSLLVASTADKGLTCLLRSSWVCPWVLVTDWRDAKPVMERLTARSDCPKPCFTLVLCSCARQLSRASKWSTELPLSVGPVYISTEDEIPPWLLSGVIQQCFGPMHDIPDDIDHDTRLSHALNACVAEKDDFSCTKDTHNCSMHELPEVNVQKGQCSDEGMYRDLPRIKEWTEVPPFPFDMPAPVTLVRRQDEMLEISDCKGMSPHLKPTPASTVACSGSASQMPQTGLFQHTA